MAKGNKAAALKPQAPAQAPAAPVTQYSVVAPKRPLTGTKHGSGTAATHGLLAAAAQANGGTLTLAQALAITKAAGDPGFARYAINRLKVLVPVAVQQS
jgi:hypothetical protein